MKMRWAFFVVSEGHICGNDFGRNNVVLQLSALGVIWYVVGKVGHS
jgi:hypothetical protein